MSDLPTVDEFFAGKPAAPAAPPAPRTPAPPPAPLPSVEEFFAKPKPTDVSAFAANPEIDDEFLQHSGLGTVLERFGQGARDGWGAKPLGLAGITVKPATETTPAVMLEPELEKRGFYRDVVTGHQAFAQAFNEQVIRPAVIAADAVMRGISAGVRGVSEVAIGAGLPRDLTPQAAWEAFPLGHVTGLPARIPPGAVGAQDISRLTGVRTGNEAFYKVDDAFNAATARARDLGVIGKGEAGWKGFPTSADQEAVQRLTPTGVESATEQVRPGTYLEETPPAEAAPPDIHAVARQVAPDTFTEFDALSAQKEAYRGQLAEMGDARQEDPQAVALQGRIDDILGKVAGVEDRLTNAQARRLAAARDELDSFLRTDTPDMQRVRQSMLQADIHMRDLAPDVSAAYREAERRMPAAEAPEAAAAPTEGPQSVAQYVDDYMAGKGRGDPAYEQFAANNAAEIEAEFQRRHAAGVGTHPVNTVEIRANPGGGFDVETPLEGIQYAATMEEAQRIAARYTRLTGEEAARYDAATGRNYVDDWRNNQVDAAAAAAARGEARSGVPRLPEIRIVDRATEGPFALPEPPAPPDDPLAMQRRGELTAASAAEIRDELSVDLASPAALERAKAAAEHLDPEIWKVMADNLQKAEASREGGVEVVADQMRYLPDDGVPKNISEREAVAVIARALDAEAARGGDLSSFRADADAAYRAAGHGTPPDVTAAEGARAAAPTVVAPAAPAPAGPPIPGGIAGDVQRQLVALGRPVEVARAEGIVRQARYEARAAAFGGAKGTAEDLYRAASTVRAGRGVTREPVAARELAQAPSEIKGHPAGEAEDAQWRRLEPETTAEGKYRGAPEWVTNRLTLFRMRRLMRKLIAEGAAGRFWYEESARRIMQITRGNLAEAEKLIGLVAIYSPQTRVFTNMTFAIKAYGQWKRGEPINVKTGAQDASAAAWLERGEDWGGRKTNNFYINLMHEIVTEHPDAIAGLNIPADVLSEIKKATVDLWVLRALGYKVDSAGGLRSGGGAANKYGFSEREIQRAAGWINKDLPAGAARWLPHQVQAALWSAVKARFELPAIKAKTSAESLKRGFSKMVADENGVIRQKFPDKAGDDRQGHMAIWRKHALRASAEDVAREVESAKGSFGDAIDRIAQNVTGEAIPAAALGHEINNASPAAKEKFTRAALGLIIDDDGNDVLAAQLGVNLNFNHIGTGTYEGGINPVVTTTLVPEKPAGFFDATLARQYARAWQYIFKQDAVPFFRADAAAKFKGDFSVRNTETDAVKRFDKQADAQAYADRLTARGKTVTVTGGPLSRGFHLEFAQDIDEALQQRVLAALQDEAGPSAGFTKTGDRELTVINYRRGEQRLPPVEDGQFADAIERVAGRDDIKAKLSKFGSEGEYGPVHDWQAERAGPDPGLAGGSPAFQSWVRDRAEAFDRLLGDWHDPERAVTEPRPLGAEPGTGEPRAAGEPGAPRGPPGEPGAGGAGGSRGLGQAQRSAEEAAAGQPKLVGLPDAPIKIGDAFYVPGPFAKAREAALKYMRKAGLAYDPPRTYARLDPERAARIADAFEAMEHNPDDPRVKASYEAMARETLAQWDAIKETGLKVEWIKPGQADPYAGNPRLAAIDVVDNNHWWGFPTDLGYGTADATARLNNPMLRLTGEVIDGRPVVVNDIFRIVHDYFGHIKEGVGFRAAGEENAWRAHAAMYSEEARGAMTAETRGQNSWVNYGPHGEANRTASAADTIYSPQKIGLLPDWVQNEGRQDAARPPTELEQARRAKIRLATETERAQVTLGALADESSLIHEWGHEWLEELKEDAADPRAPEWLKADWATTSNWLRLKEGEQIPTRAHEQFARGNERFFMEGHAPTKALAAVFARFRDWLIRIYQTVDKLNVPLTDEMRGVYGRLVASQREAPVIAPERASAPAGPRPGIAALDHLADRIGVDARDYSPEQIVEMASGIMSPEELAREIGGLEATAEHALAEFERRTGAIEGAPEPEAVYGDQPHTEEELERALKAAQTSAATQQGEGGAGAPGRPAGSEGVRPEGAGERAPGAGTADRTTTQPSEAPTAPNAAFGPSDGRLVDKAGNIRLDNLNAPEDVEQAIRDAAERNNDFVAERRGVITDGQMLDLADAIGKDPSFLNEKKIGAAFSAEEILAARKLLVESATTVRDAMIRAASGTDADVAAMAQAIARHEMIQAKVAQATAEWGRAGRAFRALEGWEGARDLNQLLKDNTGRTLNQLRQMAQLGQSLTTPAQVSKLVADSAGGRLRQAIIYYWVNTLISGPITHMTYSVGNTINALWTPLIETPLAATSGAVRRALGIAPEDSVRFHEVTSQLYGLGKGFRDGLGAAIEAYKSGVSPPLPGERIPAQFLTPQEPPIPGIVGRAIGIPGKSVAAIHSFFKTLRYEQNIQALAMRDALNQGLEGDARNLHIARLTANPTEEMMASAVADSLKELYMRRQDYSSPGALLARTTNNFLPAKIILPFVKIGSEIVRNAFIERTPLGLGSAEVRGNLALREGGAAFDQQLGKIMAGTGLMAAVTIGVLEGNITGDGPSDPNERRVWLLSHTPNTVKVGPLSFSYARLGHLGMVTRFAANMTETSQRWNDEEGGKLAFAFFEGINRSVLDETWMRGLKDALDAIYHPDEHAENFITRFVAQWTPYSIGMGQVARAIDPYQRETRDLSTAQEILNQIKSHTPLWSQSLPYRRDMFGEPITVGSGTVDRYANDRVTLAMNDLHIGVAQPERKIRGVPLTAQQYDDVARIGGRMAKMELDAVVPALGNMPPVERIKTIKGIIEHHREAAATQVMIASMGTANDILAKSTDSKAAALQGASPLEVKEKLKAR